MCLCFFVYLRLIQNKGKCVREKEIDERGRLRLFDIRVFKIGRKDACGELCECVSVREIKQDRKREMMKNYG